MFSSDDNLSYDQVREIYHRHAVTGLPQCHCPACEGYLHWDFANYIPLNLQDGPIFENAELSLRNTLLHSLHSKPGLQEVHLAARQLSGFI